MKLNQTERDILNPFMDETFDKFEDIVYKMGFEREQAQEIYNQLLEEDESK